MSKKGDYDRAIADYNKSIRLDPIYALAYRNRASLYIKKGDFNRAMADLNETIRLDPKHTLALCTRGMLKRKIDDSSGSADIAEANKLDASVCRKVASLDHRALKSGIACAQSERRPMGKPHRSLERTLGMDVPLDD